MHADLRSLATESDWYFTVALPAPSAHEDADHRFRTEWSNARRRLGDGWDDEELSAVERRVAEVGHDAAEAVMVLHARHGSTLVELLAEPVVLSLVDEGPLPRMAPVIEARQRVIPHVVVETDHAGADLTAFDGGQVLETDSVEGSTVHIHRGHPGGWSQRRFQQRAENTWESNARDVAEAVAELARKVDARLIAVSGDQRSQVLVLESLPPDVAPLATKIEAGSASGVADEVVRLLATMVAERVTEAAERVRAGVPHGTAMLDAAQVIDALDAGRVETLLVHDDFETPDGRRATEPRLEDRAIAAALASNAEVLVVPSLAMLTGPLAATLRW